MIWNENNRYTANLLTVTGFILVLLMLLGKNTLNTPNTVTEHWTCKTSEASEKLLPAEEMLVRAITACDPCTLESESLILKKIIKLQEKMKSLLEFWAPFFLSFFLFYLIWKRYLKTFYAVCLFLLKIVIQYIENCDGKKKHHLFN